MARKLVSVLFAFWLPGAIFVSAAVPRLTEERNTHGEPCFTVEFDGGRLLAADPSRLGTADRRGSRFSRGGWIDSLRDRQGRELLETTGIFPWHPGWGMPLEFRVSPELGKTPENGSLQLRPGVGILEVTDRETLRSAFPWTTQSVAGEDGSLLLRFLQEGGPEERAFRLLIEFRFADGRSSFTILVRLENRGTTDLVVENALHPFLVPAADLAATRISLPAADPKQMPHNFGLNEPGFLTVFRKRVPGWIAAGNLQSGGMLRIETQPAADHFVLWRSHRTENFAIEPVMKRVISPGSVAEWSFEIRTEP